jgi:hypothetical protein
MQIHYVPDSSLLNGIEQESHLFLVSIQVKHFALQGWQASISNISTNPSSQRR